MKRRIWLDYPVILNEVKNLANGLNLTLAAQMLRLSAQHDNKTGQFE